VTNDIIMQVFSQHFVDLIPPRFQSCGIMLQTLYSLDERTRLGFQEQA